MAEFQVSAMGLGDVHHLLASLIVPRPIAWVTSLSADGLPNLAPFSFFNGASSCPPVLMVSVQNKSGAEAKDTLNNVHQGGEFVVNLVPKHLMEQMNTSSCEYPAVVSEVEVCGLGLTPSSAVRVPRIAESPVAFECRLVDVVSFGDRELSGNAIFGRIECIHVCDSLLDERSRVRTTELPFVGRIGGDWYVDVLNAFEMRRPAPD